MENGIPLNSSIEKASNASNASLASVADSSLGYDQSNSEGFARVTSQRTWSSMANDKGLESYEVLADIDVDKMGKIQEDFLVKHDLFDFSPQCTVTLFISEKKDIVCKTLKDLKSRVEKELSFLKSTKNTKRAFWIDVCDYSKDDVDVLSQMFGIHPLTAEDVASKENREKCEIYIDEYIFVVSQLWDQGEFQEETQLKRHIYAVFSRGFVVTFRSTSNSEQIDNLTQRVKGRLQKVRHITVSPGWILYTLLDDIVDSMLPFSRQLRIECDAIEEVTQKTNNELDDVMLRITQARKLVTQFQRLVLQKSELFRIISSPKFTDLKLIDEDAFIFLEDVSGHVVSLEHVIVDCQEILNRCHSNYVANISLELTKKAEKTNNAMKKLTAVSCVLLPLSLIAGMMGMNVYVPGQLDGRDSNPAWFYGIIGLMVVVAAVLVFLGRKKKWF